MSVVSYREVLPRTFSHKLGEPPRAATKHVLTVSEPISHQAALNTIAIFHGSPHPEYSYLVCTDAQVTEPDRHHVEISYSFEAVPPGSEGGFQPNPLVRPDVFEFSTGGSQVPCLVYYQGSGNNTVKPLVNAAHDFFEGVTVNEGEVRLTVSGNRPQFPSAVAAAVTNSVNSGQYLFGGPHKWFCSGISGRQASEVVNGLVVNYWQVGAELVFRQSGHDLMLPHVGLNYLVGTEAHAVTVVGVDALRRTAATARPLNTDGTQKASGAPDILIRRIYPEVNFTTFFGTPPF